MSAPPPDLTRLADRCVLTGLCLPHCPTYTLDRIEAESPRGRIVQIRALAGDPASLGDSGALHLDQCLGCRQCERVCPAGVEYGQLLLGARAQLRAIRPTPWRQRLLEWLVAAPARIDRALGALRLLRALLPPPLRRRLPVVAASARAAGLARPEGAPLGRVGLATGCFSRRLGRDAVDASVALLTAAGFEVELAPGQGCCGALAAHAGDAAGAKALAECNRKAFSAPIEALLVLDSGCEESYAFAFEGQVPVCDPLSFLDQRGAGERLRFARLDQRVALHLPCTQRNVTRSEAVTRRWLARIPGLELVELPIGLGCCGAAGSHAVLKPDRARRLRQPLLDALIAIRPDTLASANVGCRVHLATAPGRRVPPALHPVELLARALLAPDR